MKTLLKCVVASAMMLGATDMWGAEPALIGRRGCAYGVENTAEAYREAVKRGHKYIEGHVRVTADSVFVTTHDGKTDRLGGKLKIDTSRLADLKGETYTQTREDGKTYSGSTVCTVEEFLDICRKGGAVAVLHLKNLSKGSDPRRLPELIALIERKGMMRQSVLLTAIPEYVDFLMEKAPQASLIFQADEKCEKMVDWCAERRIPVDIKKECVTPEIVRAYHDKGLKVTVWTVNTPEEYRQYADMGVDFVITDLLTPKKK